VAVDKGSHLVRFSYPAPFHGPGVWITGLTGLALLVALGTQRRRRNLYGDGLTGPRGPAGRR
jgi:MYXO-CTERM domain-containing protein